jgi:hypothetical protein
LTLGGCVAGIPNVDGVVGEDSQPAPQSDKSGVVREQLGQQAEQVVGLGHRQGLLFHQRLQVLLRTLPAVEADEVMEWRLSTV